MRTPTEIVEGLIAIGWTQRQIADATGTSQPTIHRILHGASVTHQYQLVDSLRRLERELTDLGA